MPDKAPTVTRIASRPHWLVGDLGEAAIGGLDHQDLSIELRVNWRRPLVVMTGSFRPRRRNHVSVKPGNTRSVAWAGVVQGAGGTTSAAAGTRLSLVTASLTSWGQIHRRYSGGMSK